MPSQLNHVLRNVIQFSYLAADCHILQLCLDEKSSQMPYEDEKIRTSSI
jgi:hypothetical protein